MLSAHLRCSVPVLAVLALALFQVIPTAQADPITIPGYTITDLGSGTPTFSTDSSGNGVLLAPSGQSFAFQQTPDTILTGEQAIVAGFPQLQPAPYGGGNPLDSFSYVNSASMNASGTVVATNVAGIAGHEYSTGVFVLQHNPDGTWGTPHLIYGGGGQFDLQGISSGVSTMLSQANQVLITDNTIANSNINLFLYNINTQSLINLSNLLLSAGYFGFQAIAIDDQGRIVLGAQTLNETGYSFTNLLLTPDGMSAAPLEATVPEPSTLAVMILAIAGFATRRLRERRALRAR